MKPTFKTEGDSFVLENYNQAAPFSSFFPALAGETGKPMWAFYTNRGQAISSFGVNNKDGAMVEFLPANKAYQATPHLGFRTFIRFMGKNSFWYEPFSVNAPEATQTMVVRPYELELRESNKKLGIEVVVRYFGVPTETCSSLARSVEVKNISGKTLSLKVVDGLPRVVPWGMGDFLVKNMSRTIEAFAEVANHSLTQPYFKLKVEPDDRPDVKELDAGFFSFTLNNSKLQPIIVDPTLVFDQDSSFSRPSPMFGTNGLSFDHQLTSNIMPSSFFATPVILKSKEEKTWQSYYGHTENQSIADDYVKKVQASPDYFCEKRGEIKEIYETLVKNFGFRTSDETLNAYANNTFMDNVLRGGYPLSLYPNGPIVHVFSRKHGDMERDYNVFQISASYYSQGNGNFRDVNQNRRHDVMLNPQVHTKNVEFFFNLLQLDGYNPLVINPVKFILPRDLVHHSGFRDTEDFRTEVQQLKKEPVLPGHIYEFVCRHSSDPLGVPNMFRDIIRKSVPQQGIQHGEGFWVDHWTYNLDQLDQFLSVYPEQCQWLLFEKKDFTFFDSDHYVKPRKEKVVLTKEGKLRQYHAVGVNREKKALIESRRAFPHCVRTQNGQGEIFETTLFVKLLSLALVKTSSLDPFGVGIEMDADKPGWCDALNGCPGLFGSSTHIMFELTRLIRFLVNDAISLAPTKAIDVPHEVYGLFRDVNNALSHFSGKDFRPVWDKMTTAREHFREKTIFGVTGKTRALPTQDVQRFLEKTLRVLAVAEKKAIDPKTKLPTSYFTYDIPKDKLTADWKSHPDKWDWEQHRLPPFLEGIVHPMKLWSPEKAKKAYRTVKTSVLADKKLRMYRLNASVKGESSEIGRIRVFSGGWLENESIFLHMHYKYLLEVLRSGLVTEFFEEIKSGLIPFRDKETYGRPIFENSSFLASSIFPKKDMHGKGYVARLSGATSEFIGMVYYMVLGAHPFKLVDGQVRFSPEPILPGSWFSAKEDEGVPKGSLGITLFGVPIQIINPARKNTFGPSKLKPMGFEWILDGRFHTCDGPSLPHGASLALREGRLESLTVFIGK